MDEKRKPYATIFISRSGVALILAISLTATVLATALAAYFLREQQHKDAQLARLQESLSIAEARASDREEALQDSESDIRSLEATLRETEERLASNEVHLPMPLGFIDASEYDGPELYFISCVRIMVGNSQAPASYDRGAALTRYRVWDSEAVRQLLDTGKYQLVGKSSWSFDWGDKLDQEFYLLKDVMDRNTFAWPRDRTRNNAYWDWYNHMDQDCRLHN